MDPKYLDVRIADSIRFFGAKAENNVREYLSPSIHWSLRTKNTEA